MAQPLNKKNLHQVVDHLLQQHHDRIAIEQDGRACGYAELDAASRDLCDQLRALGVQRGDVVALPMPASIDYVTALLAVVRCGAIFMPLDPAFPEARLRRALELASPRALVASDAAVARRIAQLGGVAHSVVLPAALPAAPAAPQLAGDDDTGYLITTSGSTGEPKLIAGRNKGISHFVHWEVAEFGIGQDVRASFFAPPTFDVSLREIFVPLLAGGTLAIPAPDVRGDARRLAGWLRAQRITLMHCVPSLLRLLTRALAEQQETLPSLRLVALAGEPLYGADVSAWRAAAGGGAQMVNLYGPSETTLAKAFHRIGDDTAPNAIVPLGQPINNTALLILRDGRLCETGEIGELHILTPFASNGYHGQPALTAAAFIPNPLAPESGERLYRTGDLARYRADRSVEFVGRADRQVKVNGVRIELPEVEGAMRSHAAVTEAVAHTFRRDDGEAILVGYYTADAELDAQAVRASMQASLPDNMLPGYLLQLPQFPRNLNGKIDRKALPRPEALLARGPGYTAPEGELEQELARLWAEALGLERVGATSAYLHIGGNSLRAIGLIGRIGQRFGIDLTIRDFFQHQTVRALAAHIGTLRRPASQPIAAAPEQDSYPLTDAQAGLWILDRIDQARALYNNVEWLELHGELDVAALQAALDQLVQRHESLRTAYFEADGAPRQRILAAVGLPLHSEDAGAAAPARVAALLRAERERSFDLASGEVVRATLVRQTPQLHHLLINMHHIACDGWSMAILVRELCDGYQPGRALSAAVTVRPAMRDLACWLEAADTPAERAGTWRARLADAGRRAAIPSDLAPGADPLAAGAARRCLAPATAAALRARLAALGATPFMASAAALAILLYRYGGSDVVVIGTPVAARTRAELAGTVGFMVNTLPLCLRLSPELDFSTLLERTRGAIEDLADHPFDNPVRWAAPAGSIDPARHPFYDVVLAMEPAPAALPLAGLQVVEREVPDAPARNDLSLRLQDDGAGLTLILEYRQSMYCAATAEALLEQLERLLETASAEPALPLKRLPMLDAAQSAALLRLAQGPSQPLPQETIHQAFTRQAQGCPDAVALVLDGEQHSYRWLEQRANHLAAVLTGQFAVRPGDVVGVLLGREADWPASILAVLKAGAVYLPLDPWHPAGRHAQLLDDAGARVLIGHDGAAGGALLDPALHPGLEAAAAPQALGPDAPAYLIYTSGSTGTPKGVLVPHRAFMNMIVDQVKALGVDQHDTVLQFVAPGFDVSLFEVFLALLSGARLALAERRACGSAAGFASAVARLRVTIAAMTPGFLNALGELPLDGLRMIISGGEAPIEDDVRRRLAQGIRYVNAYGPTEAAVCAAFHELDARAELPRPVPLGRPTANTALHVVAPDLTPLPAGAVGELAISGAGLALEYYRRPAATAQAFASDSLAAGEQRLYRTGDRVRRLADGSLVFVGRADSQVKIRGHRVELGEVEAALRALDGVADARVLARALGADHELAAYWSGTAEPDALRAALAQRLPEYMVPRLVRMDALPLNANGKLDRSRLPDPGATASGGAARDGQERQLAALWAELLEREQVGRDDNFFDCGGRSLAANRLALRASRALGVEVDLRDVYAAPTPAALAQRLRGRAAAAAALPLLPPGQPAPASPMQRRLWVIEQLGDSGAAYHICGLTGLEGQLDPAALRAAFNDVAARHAVLRTRFVAENGEPMQVTDAGGEVPWQDLAPAEPAAQQQALEAIAAAPFRLAHDWPIRVALAADGPGRWKLLIVLHHIAADGWSMPILEAELSQAYAARLQGRAPAWAPLPAQYRDVAAWLHQRLQGDAYAAERDYWLARFADPAPLLDLPADRPRPALRRFRGATLEHVLAAPAAQAARACAEAHGVTLFTVLLAAFQTLLYRLSGQDDLVVGVPVAGRQHPASEGLVGFFVNTLALRERIAGQHGFAARLAAAAHTVQEGMLHQNYPFDRLVGELNLERDTARAPLFDVMIGLDEAPATPDFPGLAATPLPLARGGSRCDMAWMFDFGAAAPALRVEFDTDLFDAARIAGWMRRFELLLCAAARDPQAALDRLDLLDPDERAALLRDAAAPPTTVPDTTVNALFEHHAAHCGDAPALVEDGASWTYGELDRAANRLARQLRRERPDPRAPLALLCERGALMAVAQLAAMKCGAPYVPIEPDAPAQRVRLLLQDSGADCVLATPGRAAAAPEGVRVLELDVPAGEDDAPLPPAATPDSPLYVMYTSGSTGRPKGVVALQRGVVRLVRDALYYTPQAGDRVLQLSNYAFDGATFDFYAALANGLPLCIPDKDTLLDPHALAAFVRRHAVNVGFITTALFNRLVDETPQLLGCFRRLYFGGQEASLAHVRRALAHMAPGALVHVYGPTECTTFATWHTVRESDVAEGALRLPIGRPVAHTSAYLLDPQRMLLPPGMPGELYIGGAGLAQGYLGQPELSAERFVAAPFDPAARLYRTGDLCQMRPDGALEFLGRLDGQVKVRGFRIELGEVEHHLASCPGVEQVHVMPRTNASGNAELVAYLTPRAGQPVPTPDTLRAQLERSLPRYMLPAHFVLLDALPVNRNGKVDRGALPAPQVAAAQPAGAASSGDGNERTLLEAWQAVLGRDAIGLHDNYYALGGDSIQAIQIVSRLRARGLALKVTDLLRYPTIAQLAPLLAGARREPARQDAQGAIALTPIQHWMLERRLRNPAHFNQSVLLRLPAGTDPARIARVLDALERTHAALRLRFGIGADGQPWQQLAAPAPAALAVHDCRGADGAARMQEHIDALQRSLQPESGPIWRSALLRRDDGDRLLVTIHHWAVDGVSWRILLEDLALALEQSADPQAAIALPEPSQGLGDWSQALRSAAASERFGAQRDYWQRQMSTPVGALPVLAAAAPAPLAQRLMLGFTLPREQTEALFGACHAAYRTRSDELLLAAWVRTLTAVQGHPACRIVLESHGREALADSIDVGRTVGWFTAIYPLVFALEGTDWSGHIRQVKETLRAVPDHGIGYGLLRYLARTPQLDGPTGEVVFNYLGRFDHQSQPLALAEESTGDEIDPAIRLEQGLDISAELRDGELRVRLAGDTARHPEACFHALRDGLRQALDELIAHCLAADGGALSPSDVDLQGIGIDDLDSILDSLEQP